MAEEEGRGIAVEVIRSEGVDAIGHRHRVRNGARDIELLQSHFSDHDCHRISVQSDSGVR
jgi:hypothetical protein